jgi:tRNA wybutosine-synthesizing protein 1
MANVSVEAESSWLSLMAGRLKAEKYQLVGRHSAVKKCSWLHQSLVHGRVCYKQKFYGIQSHRCLQMTPSAYHCTLRCLFCWRVQPEDLGFKSPPETSQPIKTPDDPDFIVEESIKAQRRILSGYKAHENLDKARYEEALNPAHAAISLTGEPTLYPRLGELIEAFHRRGMTTFLVSNATMPETLLNLSREPSQLYLSLHAPAKEVFQRVCRPLTSRGWAEVCQSIEAVKSFSCPTVLRLTLVKGLNMSLAEAYARLIVRAEPTYVEPKAYMWVGFSRRRGLRYEHMPTHREVKAFAEKLSELTGYRLIGEAAESRVALLSRLHEPLKVKAG